MKSKTRTRFSELSPKEIGVRVRKLRADLDLNQAEFAELLGFSGGYISEVEHGKKVPGGEFVASLKRATGRSTDWILTGDSVEVLHDSEGGAIAIPLFLSPVSAGMPTPADSESAVFRIPQDVVDHPSHFAVRVAGYSMIEAGIRYGDLLLCDRKKEPRRGDIVVAVVDGETLVKRLEFLEEVGGRRVLLYPENRDMAPIDITDREGIIQGVVNRLLRDVR